MRLFNYDSGRLFSTFACSRCAFSLGLTQVTAGATADGRPSELRSWQSSRVSVAQAAWVQGRNQALFVARNERGLEELFVQPWIGLVGSLGAPNFTTAEFTCHRDGAMGPRGSRRACGTTPAGAALRVDTVRNGMQPRRPPRHRRRTRAGSDASFGSVKLVANRTADLASLQVPGGHMISLTTHLVRLRRPGTSCTALLGVAHLHRGLGDCMTGKHCLASNGASVFRWGFKYTHFLYTLSPVAPPRLGRPTGCDRGRVRREAAGGADAPRGGRGRL